MSTDDQMEAMSYEPSKSIAEHAEAAAEQGMDVELFEVPTSPPADDPARLAFWAGVEGFILTHGHHATGRELAMAMYSFTVALGAKNFVSGIGDLGTVTVKVK